MVNPTAPSPVETLHQLDEALDQALDAAWISGSRDELHDALVAMPKLVNKLSALRVRLTETANNAGVRIDGKYRKLDHLVGAETNADPAECRRDLRLARWLGSYPKFRRAFAAGEMSVDHLEHIRKGTKGPAIGWLLLRDQQILVDAARDCTFADFGQAFGYWRNAADPDGTLPKEQIRGTRLSVTRQPDGSVKISGKLDPLLGTTVLNAVDREAERIFEREEAAGDANQPGRRRAEALAALVTRGAARSDGSMPAPLLNIVMSQRVAEQLLARLDDPSIDIELDPNDIDGRLELIDGTPLHPQFVLATLGVATLRRHVLDAKSRIIDTSVNARSFPEWMRNAALITTRGRCIETGCDAPFAWLQSDHRKPAAKGGPTQLDNLDPLCRPGNRHKTDTWTQPDTPDRTEPAPPPAGDPAQPSKPDNSNPDEDAA